MKAIRLLAIALFLVLFSNCQYRSMGFIMVEPYAKPFITPVNQPIHLIISDEIPDLVTVQAARARPLKVNHYRKSLVAGLEHTLKKKFQQGFTGSGKATGRIISSRIPSPALLGCWRTKGHRRQLSN